MIVKVFDLDTPGLIIREALLLRNIGDMAEYAQQVGVKLRPHIKAHKLPAIAKAQLAMGAVGITVAKLGEAEVMMAAGFTDILIANQVIGEHKIKRLLALSEKADIKVTVDSLAGIRALNDVCLQEKKQIKVFIEVNTGLNRCGVLPGEAVLQLAKEIKNLSQLNFQGIMTHAGQAYGAQNIDQVSEIGKFEGQEMVKTANLLEKQGIPVSTISVGSTPTAKFAGMIKGVTEIRPGNYVFYDGIQIALGVAIQDDCALSILATVISKPSSERLIIDAGSKTLALDQGAHGKSMVRGFGMVKDHPEIIIERLSEEHGILKVSPDCPLEIGDKIEIIPNHACTVINLADEINLVRNQEVIEVWEIKARGKVR